MASHAAGAAGRTRRLEKEAIGFQQELERMREELARHYRVNTSYSGSQIALLPGYDGPNSSFRAFHAWADSTPATNRCASRRRTLP